MNNIFKNKEEVNRLVEVINHNMAIMRDDQSKPVDKEITLSLSLSKIICSLNKLTELINNPQLDVQNTINLALTTTTRLVSYDYYNYVVISERGIRGFQSTLRQLQQNIRLLLEGGN